MGTLNSEVIASTDLATNTTEIKGVVVIMDNGDRIEAFLPQGMLDVISKDIRVRVVPETDLDFEWSVAEVLPDGVPTPNVIQTAEALLDECSLKGAFPANGVWDLEMLSTLADKLADESGCKVEIMLIAPDAINLTFVTEHADFSLLSFSEFLDLQEYQPSTPILVPSYYTSSGYYRGAIIAPLDSPAQKLEDLQGKSFAYYGKEDMYSYLMPKIMLSDEGYDPNNFFSETLLISSSTLAMINAVIEGEADAGVVWEIEEANALEWAEGDIPDVHEHVKIIDHTYWVPNTFISVRSSLPDVLQTALKDAFMKILESDSGKELFYDLSEIKELNEPDERTWYAIDAIQRAEALEDEIGGWPEEPED
jgi:phosphonate transport system substrate-binding protein